MKQKLVTIGPYLIGVYWASGALWFSENRNHQKTVHYVSLGQSLRGESQAMELVIWRFKLLWGNVHVDAPTLKEPPQKPYQRDMS